MDEITCLSKSTNDNNELFLGWIDKHRYHHMSKFAIWTLIALLLFYVIAHPEFNHFFEKDIPNPEYRFIFQGLIFFIILYLLNGFIFHLHRV